MGSVGTSAAVLVLGLMALPVCGHDDDRPQGLSGIDCWKYANEQRVTAGMAGDDFIRGIVSVGWYDSVPREDAIQLIESFGTSYRDWGGSNSFVSLCVPEGTEDAWVNWLEFEQETAIIEYAERDSIYRTRGAR